MIDNIRIITYKETLNLLENSQDNHLLLGNGFNLSLGIKTSYTNIFQNMKSEYTGYNKVDIENFNYDIEKMISHFQGNIQDNEFLRKYIQDKIKIDFMKATASIVKSSIKNIYQEKNQEIHLFFRNFKNYFTLNFDPFLYLLLMKFKRSELNEKTKTDNNSILVFANRKKFIKDDLDRTLNDIYTKITDARNNGSLQITANNMQTNKELGYLKKTDFESLIKQHFEKEKWKSKDIKKVCDLVWEQEKQKQELNINDGFLFEEYKPENYIEQNLFFLHGAFHIYNKGKCTRKITQQGNISLYNKLYEIVNDEYNEIICVLQAQSEEKKENIFDNDYLTNCYNELKRLSGSMVIFGSSLDENDKHIFNQINNSRVDTLYISSCQDTKTKDFKKANQWFTNKKIILFDYMTVSYNESYENDKKPTSTQHKSPN